MKKQNYELGKMAAGFFGGLCAGTATAKLIAAGLSLAPAPVGKVAKLMTAVGTLILVDIVSTKASKHVADGFAELFKVTEEPVSEVITEEPMTQPDLNLV